ncbi:hypothetical protein CMU55_19385 [Elizabethkingia anophelis]|uniref:hypothetical protein n=1 Tax=Elizabethkingia anophelis TaxID=1117645 RepID=UPI00099AA32C|nr:hypothetical protein [Elizabethkingia anophelis]MDV3673649.1 hypothetical protein [Elizabethkingia anophelis]MDV3692373.1 hypothetical protein [Elizabethkingia anophelis]MDV3706668.1 hypothetical protein [Elizabethkingia anophelis]OPB50096.1 hypothetical protein BAY04_06980 [Elizabethkingia anophelis]SPW16754.1 Uncharacterised protein [Elizabethkingia anophelis]
MKSIKQLYIEHGEKGELPCCLSSTQCRYGTPYCAANKWEHAKNTYPLNMQDIKSRQDLEKESNEESRRTSPETDK